MSARMAPILESRWARVALMTVVALMFATVLSLSSPKSASAHTVCGWYYYNGYGWYYQCYWDGRDEALQAALDSAAYYNGGGSSIGNYQQLVGDYSDPYVVNWRGYFNFAGVYPY